MRSTAVRSAEYGGTFHVRPGEGSLSGRNRGSVTEEGAFKRSCAEEGGGVRGHRSDEPLRLGCVHGQKLERNHGNQPASRLQSKQAVWKLTLDINLLSIPEPQEGIVIDTIHGALSTWTQGLSLQGRWPHAGGSKLSQKNS